MNLRIEHIFREEMKGDTSFQEKESGLSLLFGTVEAKLRCRIKCRELTKYDKHGK